MKRTALKIAVIVNDMSEINIDGSLVKKGDLIRTDEKLVEMQNGCICCTLRDDLLIEVQKLAENGGIDYILIESSGISEPIPVAQTFTYKDEELDIDLSKYCRLDTMVTVVDGSRFFEDFASGESLLERKQAADETDSREVADLLIEQIEFADVLILNKTDLLNKEEQEKLFWSLRKLNPDCRIISSTFAKVPISAIMNTKSFDFEKSSQSAGWIKELNEEHTPETEEFGISSFVYQKQRPFHPERLKRWLENWPPHIIRAKGFFWLASRNDTAGLLSQAGSSLMIQSAGPWIAASPEEEQKLAFEEDPHLKTDWDETYGDRKTEIVFIGIDMNQEDVIRSLDQTLLTDKEMNSDWSAFHDSLPEYI